MTETKHHLARAALTLGATIALAACGSNDAPASSASASSGPPPKAAPPAASTSAAPADENGVAELKDFRIFPEGPAKAHHFIAEIAIAKGSVVKDPMFRVVFKDADGKAVDTGSCAYRGVIKPGDRVPCYGAIWKAEKWAKYEVTLVPPQDAVPADSAELKVSDAALVAGKNEVDGKVTNTGKTPLKNVTAYVSFFGADGKVVGGNSAAISVTDLAPGASGSFAVAADDVAAPPKTFAVKMSP